jgi:molybdopterin synthase catalytic subunit
MNSVIIQQADFDVADQINWLRANTRTVGAIVSFVGLVRDMDQNETVQKISLEHYPGMSERCISEINAEAKGRWDVSAIQVIHRVGELDAGDQIVLVLVAAKHRKDAFMACEFVMDYLKVDAPFWKKEFKQSGEYWVDAKLTDDEAKNRWLKT